MISLGLIPFFNSHLAITILDSSSGKDHMYGYVLLFIIFNNEIYYGVILANAPVFF